MASPAAYNAIILAFFKTNVFRGRHYQRFSQLHENIYLQNTVYYPSFEYNGMKWRAKVKLVNEVDGPMLQVKLPIHLTDFDDDGNIVQKVTIIDYRTLEVDSDQLTEHKLHMDGDNFYYYLDNNHKCFCILNGEKTQQIQSVLGFPTIADGDKKIITF